jgi:hypothetical protein
MRGVLRLAGMKKGSGLDTGPLALLKKEMSGCVPTSGALRYPFLHFPGQPRDPALTELYPFGKSTGAFQSSDVNEAVGNAINGLQLFLAH